MKTWRRTVLLAVCAALLFSGMPRAAGKAEALPELAEEESILQINGELEPKTLEEMQQMLDAATEAYFGDPELAEELRDEITEETVTNPFTDEGQRIRQLTLTHEGQSMRGLIEVRGEADENGRYPLYLALHGGGEDESVNNDSEWFGMYNYYRESVENGIYIACRGITDTWDLHFRPESYPLYDRLIQAMIFLYQADPDRVYLLGFSAGGDGVYQVTPRMADRFAAANMSSGHPNGVSLRNLMNCGFSIQVGIRDYYTEEVLRCVRGAEFDRVLDDLHEEFGYGYPHQVLVHVPDAHNYDDYSDGSLLPPEFAESEEELYQEVLANPSAFADPAITEEMMYRFLEAFRKATGSDSVMDMSYTSAGFYSGFDEECREIVENEFHLETTRVNAGAVHYVSGFVRNPAPEEIFWDLGTRAPLRKISSFYWLRADPSVTEGTIHAAVTEDNGILVEPEGLNGDFSILIPPTLLDLSRPVRITLPEGTFTVRVNPSEETLAASMRETGDPSLAWVAEIPCSLLTGGGENGSDE